MSKGSKTEQEQRLRETLAVERAAGAEWAQVAGDATVRVKELENFVEACREILLRSRNPLDEIAERLSGL